MRLNKIQKAAIAALEDIKARDIAVLDTRKLTSMYDALIIATADSARQTKALARNVHERVKTAGGTVLSTEGEEGGEWVLVDCADFVVHIMQPAARALYDLESLWASPTPTRKPARKPSSGATPAAASSRTKRPSNPTAATPVIASRRKPSAKTAGASSEGRNSAASAPTPSAGRKPAASPRLRRRLPE